WAARSGGSFTPRFLLSSALRSEGLLPSDSLSTMLPCLFGASSNSTTLPLFLWACGDHVRRTREVFMACTGLGSISLSSSYSSL
ncbi:hypothetical protein Tco_1150802, partial [Tanacetum coccineum]